MAHTKAQKDKVRKSGLSLQNKTQDLGRFCDIFSALVYWNPTHERWDTAMHASHGQQVPDLNRIVCPHPPATLPSSDPTPLLTAAVSPISRLPCGTEPRSSDTIAPPCRSC